MAALAPSPDLALDAVGSPTRRRAIGTGERGRDRAAFEPIGRGLLDPGESLSRRRLVPREPEIPSPSIPIVSAAPLIDPIAADAVSSAPAVAPPSPRGETAEAASGSAPHVARPDATSRLPGRPRRRLPTSALVAAILLHGAAAATLLSVPRPVVEGGGLEVVAMVELMEDGPIDSTDATAGSVPVTPASAETLPDAPRRDDPPVEPDTPPRDDTATAVATPEAEPPIPEPAPVTTEAPIEAPPVLAAEAAAEAVPPPATPAPAPPVAADRASEPRPAPPKQKPKPKPERTAKAAEPAPRRNDRAAATPTAPGNAAADRRSAGATRRAETPAAGSGEVASWRAAVLAALARAKRYPEDARALGRTGRAVVTFTIGRDGRVTDVALASSSGFGSIDRATLAMPTRAAFPPMPAGAGTAQTFTAGVRYDLH